MNVADIFNGAKGEVLGDWNEQYQKLIKKFVAGVRAKGYHCDILQQKQIAGGIDTLLFISEGGEYREHYHIAYSGLEIKGGFVNVQ